MEEINYLLIIVSAFAAIASPGPATLAIAGASMKHGRYLGLSLAAGVLTGSLLWSAFAAFGLAALMHTNVWLFETLRYCGALYLLYLAWKSLRSAFQSASLELPDSQISTVKGNYVKGLLIHLTNPKAVLFFGALYSMGVPAAAGSADLISVILVVGVVSSSVFLGYAALFSRSGIRQLYLRSKRGFEILFALFFGAASLKLLLGASGK